MIIVLFLGSDTPSKWSELLLFRRMKNKLHSHVAPRTTAGEISAHWILNGIINIKFNLH
jgi:hypothetical protein